MGVQQSVGKLEGWAHLAELGGWLALLAPAGQLALVVVVVVAVLATDDVMVPLVGAVAARAIAPYSPLALLRSVLRRAPFRRSSTSSSPTRLAALAPAGSKPAGEVHSMGTRAVKDPPSADRPDRVVLPRLQKHAASRQDRGASTGRSGCRMLGPGRPCCRQPHREVLCWQAC
jgi:hypothetical protein